MISWTYGRSEAIENSALSTNRNAYKIQYSSISPSNKGDEGCEEMWACCKKPVENEGCGWRYTCCQMDMGKFFSKEQMAAKFWKKSKAIWFLQSEFLEQNVFAKISGIVRWI